MCMRKEGYEERKKLLLYTCFSTMAREMGHSRTDRVDNGMSVSVFV